MELCNSFTNMWKYDGLTYSTYYGFGNRDLQTNMNCLAYFAGGYQKPESFYEHGHCDIYSFRMNSHSLPEEHVDFVSYDTRDLLTFAPLFPNYFRIGTNLMVPTNEIDDPYLGINDTIHYPYNPDTNKTAFVTKVAIARPLYYTGAIRTMIIFACKNYEENVNFEDFYIGNSLHTIEMARVIGKIEHEVENEELMYIEYKKTDKDYYPLLWVQFQT